MKKAVSIVIAVLFFMLSGFTVYADNSFRLLDSNKDILGGSIVYQPEQQIFRLTKGETYSVELSADRGLYLFITVGGYESGSGSGAGDNGINCGCEIIPECFDKDGNIIAPAYAKLFTPADGTFSRYRIGADDKYSGLPEGTEKIRLTINAVGDRQYIRALEIHTSDTKAMDLSLREWESHKLGNINSETTRADYWIMVGFVVAVAAVMIIVRKARDNSRKKK